MHWQQFTGPAMAKGLEDTTFYVHNPLLSVNEVGSDCKGTETLLGIEAFHRHSIERLERQPFTMNASSTHDTKRGEDTRARIDVLSEIPEEWERSLKQWSEWNSSDSAPDRNEQIFIYQTLMGAWPVSRNRLKTYLIKALREAKTHTNWLRPDERYEESVVNFVDRLLDPERSSKFLASFRAFHKRIAYFGAINSFSQTLLKITAPGTPDFYQGTELWDFSLADPDNRHPVDFEIRKAWLEWLKSHDNPKELMANWRDGRIKMFLIWKSLNFRRRQIDLFLHGDYIPIETTGRHATNVIAFARRNDNRWAIIVVPRLSSQITRSGSPPVGEAVWADTRLTLPPECPTDFHDIFTGNRVTSPFLSMILSDLPFSLIYS
jgi:(1->4)-alpha-D-glucan 1-alpha-D-glucosylmutase